MKVSVLVVDDDVEMLDSMCNMIRRYPEEFELAGTAEDGVEALELVRRRAPDILLADISMPAMDGLTLIARSLDIAPRLRSVLITCHEEFQYAKQAIELRVYQYLIKYTLTEKELIRCLRKLRGEIETERESHEHAGKLAGEINRNKERFQEQLLRAISKGAHREAEQLLRRAELYDVTIADEPFVLAGLYIDDLAAALTAGELDDGGMLLFAATNILRDMLEQRPVFAAELDGRIYALLYGRDKTQAEALEEELRRVQNTLFDVLKVRFSVVLGPECGGLAELGGAIAQNTADRELYFYDGSGRVAHSGGEHRPVFPPLAVPAELTARFRAQVFHAEALEDAVAGIFAYLRRGRYAPSEVRGYFEELNAILNSSAQFTGGVLNKDWIDGATFEDCARQMMENIRYRRVQLARENRGSMSEDIMAVITYISEHLSETITLETMAELVYKNSSYLSRSFKRETGMTFSEYLIKQRVEKALELLERSELTVEEIAERVGIYNIQYFYKFFKRETGKTPGELRHGRPGS